jgi:hypothetical protein
MQPNRYVAVFGVLSALALCVIPVSAEKGNGPAVNHGEKAKMSPKGKENTNAQWSADPDRGWIRAEERHELQRRQGLGSSKQNRGKQITKANESEKQKKDGRLETWKRQKD